MADELVKPYPVPTPVTEPFWQALNDERVLLQRCDDCEDWIFYPRTNCPRCLGTSLTWKEVSGAGTVYTYTIARQPTSPHFVDETPQAILMVDLDEGVRLTSTLVEQDLESVTVGARVTPFFDHINTHTTLLRFQLA